jgi:TRAP-type C4-dicarboxylate transport system, small permease component
MLWMTGLIAPSAYRWGGFVSIEMLFRLLPSKIIKFLTLILLMVSLMVLVVALYFGLKHVESGLLFYSSSLKWPLHLIGMEDTKMKLAWMYMSLPVGLTLMTLINIELIIKNFIWLWNPNFKIPEDPDQPKTEKN